MTQADKSWIFYRQRVTDKLAKCTDESCLRCMRSFTYFMKNFLLCVDESHSCARWFQIEAVLFGIDIVDSLAEGHCCKTRRQLDFSPERNECKKAKRDFWFQTLAELIEHDILSSLIDQINSGVFSNPQKPFLVDFLLAMHTQVSRWQWLFISKNQVLLQKKQHSEPILPCRIAYKRDFLRRIDATIEKVRSSIG